MADIVDKYRIESDTKAAQKDVEKFGKASSESFLKSQLAAQAMTAAFSATIDFVKSAAAAVNDYERTVENQERALKSAGLEVAKYRAEFDALSGELQKTAGISDEVLRELQTLSVNMGVAPENMRRYTEAAIRLSRVTGRDLKGSLEALIKTEQGVIDRTLKVIPGFEDLTKEQLANGGAIDVVNDGYSEFLAVSERLPGQLKILKDSFDDVIEAVGLEAGQSGTLIWGVQTLNEQLEILLARIQNTGRAARGWIQDWKDLLGLGGDEGKAGPTTGEGKVVGTFTTTETIDVPSKPDKGGKTKRLPGYAQDDPQAAMEEAWRKASEQAKEFRALDKELQQSRADREADANAKVEAMREDHISYLQKLNKQRDAEDAESARKFKELVKEQEEASKEMMDNVSSAIGIASGLIENVIVAAASGSEEAMAKTLLNFVGMLGNKMVAMGTGHVLEGIAMNAALPGSGVPLMVAGGAEVAFGTAVGAGSAIAGNAISGGGGGAATATAGMGGGASSNIAAGSSRQAPPPIVFQVFGEPSPRMGKMIKDSVNLLDKRGLR